MAKSAERFLSGKEVLSKVLVVIADLAESDALLVHLYNYVCTSTIEHNPSKGNFRVVEEEYDGESSLGLMAVDNPKRGVALDWRKAYGFDPITPVSLVELAKAHQEELDKLDGLAGTELYGAHIALATLFNTATIEILKEDSQ